MKQFKRTISFASLVLGLQISSLSFAASTKGTAFEDEMRARKPLKTRIDDSAQSSRALGPKEAAAAKTRAERPFLVYQENYQAPKLGPSATRTEKALAEVAPLAYAN